MVLGVGVGKWYKEVVLGSGVVSWCWELMVERAVES